MQCGQLGSLPSDRHSGPCSASVRGTGQAAPSLRFTFRSQTWTAIFAPRNHLEWVLKPSQLMSQETSVISPPHPIDMQTSIGKMSTEVIAAADETDNSCC